MLNDHKSQTLNFGNHGQIEDKRNILYHYFYLLLVGLIHVVLSLPCFAIFVGGSGGSPPSNFEHQECMRPFCNLFAIKVAR